MRDNLEHGWLVGRRCDVEYDDERKVRVGRCACCDEEIYEDEELETYVITSAGELLCIDCNEEVGLWQKAM